MIELHDANSGEPILIDTAKAISISPLNCKEGSFIVFHTCNYSVKETYEDIKRIIGFRTVK